MPVPGLFAALTAPEVGACGREAGAACLFVFRRSHNDVLARGADWVIARPLRIALIVVLALIASRLLQRAIRHFLAGLVRASTASSGSIRASQRAETIGLVLRSIAKVTVVSIAALMVLDELGLDLAPLLAGAGIVGVAVGFGSQTLVRDFLSGMFMLIEDQFGVGDTINTGEATGVVEGISLRVTRLRDEAGVVWHIPNGEIKRVANRSQAGG